MGLRLPPTGRDKPFLSSYVICSGLELVDDPNETYKPIHRWNMYRVENNLEIR
jgi:hypothetical protein